MLKKIAALNPASNRNIAFLFSFLFLTNSIYYAYHAIFTPFTEQLVNSRLIYLLLIIVILFLFSLRRKGEKIRWKKSAEVFILTLLPSAVLIVIGYFSHPESFKNNSRVFANLIITASSFIFFLKFLRYAGMEDFFSIIRKKEFIKSNRKRTDFLTVFILSLVIISNLAFGLYHLAEFAAVDEPLWTFERIPKFWNNTLDGEWQKTMISDKPGITVALLSGTGLLFVNPKEYKLIKQEGEIKFTAGNIEKVNFPMRFPILLFSALMLFIFFRLLSKLFNNYTALLSILFIGLSPILLGISRIINPDSLFWIFSSLSLLSYLLSIKRREIIYSVLAGMFLGLSLLTKYVANIFFVFYFGMIFADFFLNSAYGKEEWRDYFKQAAKKYFIVVYFSILTFFIFLPAAWVNLGRIAEGTVLSEAFSSSWLIFLIIVSAFILEALVLKGKIFGFIFYFISRNKSLILKIFLLVFFVLIVLAVLNTFSGMKWIDFENILASPKSTVLNPTSVIGVFLANFYPLIFGIHPIALFSVSILLIALILKNNFREQKDERGIWIAYILFFIFLYYTASFLNKVGATVRYQVIIYPLIFIAASAGIDFIFSRFGNKIKIAVFGITALFLLFSLKNIRPFYFSYASEILPEKYILNLKDMGDGSYEAAQYLNSLPDAENLIVWTDKRGVCYFFKGGCFDAFEMNKGMRIDYFVISAGRESRTIRHIPYKGRHNDFEIQVDKIYENDNYEYRLDIGGRPNNFIKIFSYEKLAGEKK
ncbi:MAG: glycosyltransferase family 39 protein [bacterium]|nr:glycosyltransferase family 39 protein [bacterium]